jgi:hypothetical protein
MFKSTLEEVNSAVLSAYDAYLAECIHFETWEAFLDAKGPADEFLAPVIESHGWTVDAYNAACVAWLKTSVED